MEVGKEDTELVRTCCRCQSDLLTPKKNLLLLKVATILLIDENQVERIAAAVTIIDVFICRCQVSRGKVEANGDKFTFDWCTVHDLEFAKCLLLCDCIRVSAYRLLANDGELHHFDLYTHQVEADLAEDAVLQVE